MGLGVASNVLVDDKENTLGFGEDSESELVYVVEKLKSNSEAFEEGRRIAGDAGARMLGVIGEVGDSPSPSALRDGLLGPVYVATEEVDDAQPDDEEAAEWGTGGVARHIGGNEGTGGILETVDIDELGDLWAVDRKRWLALGG